MTSTPNIICLNQHSLANLWEGGACCTIFSPRWVKALDMLLDKLRVAGLDFTTVRVLSFCAFNCGDVVCFLIFASNCEPRFEKETVTLLSIALSP